MRLLHTLLRRTSRCSLHLAACLVCAIVLLLMAAAPHVHMVVCTGTCCVVEEEPESCCAGGGCCGERQRREREPGEEGNRGQCRVHCCIDLLVDVEPAPVPLREVRELPQLVCHLPPAPPIGAAATPWREWSTPHDTGPPRVDRRTRLIASTVLRL